jgi:hypothetical protein
LARGVVKANQVNAIADEAVEHHFHLTRSRFQAALANQRSQRLRA